LLSDGQSLEEKQLTKKTQILCKNRGQKLTDLKKL